jgi:predicted acylesterase/phospholipase RssA
MTKLPMAGASSGSLVAVLSACGVDPQLMVDGAYQLAVDNDIWNRKLGLLGIWGGLIRNWLDELLPDNAHELVAGRVHVIIAKAPTLALFEVRCVCSSSGCSIAWTAGSWKYLSLCLLARRLAMLMPV